MSEMTINQREKQKWFILSIVSDMEGKDDNIENTSCTVSVKGNFTYMVKDDSQGRVKFKLYDYNNDDPKHLLQMLIAGLEEELKRLENS